MNKDGELAEFVDTVWQHFKRHGRHDLPWRLPEPDGTFDPYKIVVSEMMLQQTQVPRVIPKYREFLDVFPGFDSLAAAPLAAVLRVWNGLGYNRRAKFLWQTAQLVCQTYGGRLPAEPASLVQLPGVGANTAGAIVTYAFNQPAVFIETNIRTAYIYHFFQGRETVADSELATLIAATLENTEPRLWGWALMDYGAFLKQTIGNLNKLSKSYAKQSLFAGSRRQLRGQIIRLLSARPMSRQDLQLAIDDERLDSVLRDLTREMMIAERSDIFALR